MYSTSVSPYSHANWDVCVNLKPEIPLKIFSKIFDGKISRVLISQKLDSEGFLPSIEMTTLPTKIEFCKLVDGDSDFFDVVKWN